MASTCYGSVGRFRTGACGMGIESACFRRAHVAGTTENRPVVVVLGLSFEARIAGGVTVINHGAQTPAMLRSVVLQGSRGSSVSVCAEALTQVYTLGSGLLHLRSYSATKFTNLINGGLTG